MISGGYGKLADKTFRIGHMGEWNLAGIKDVIAQHRLYLGIVVTIKILVSDKIADEGIKILQEEGYEVTRGWDIPKPDLPKIIGEYDVLIVRSATKVKGELLDNAKKLRVIGRAGEGLDNVDYERAKQMGIHWLIRRMFPTSASPNSPLATC